MKTKRKRLVLLLVLIPVLCCGLSLNVFAAGEDLQDKDRQYYYDHILVPMEGVTLKNFL